MPKHQASASLVFDRKQVEVGSQAAVVAAQGLDADALLAAALAEDNKRGLMKDVDEAIARGIFGAPSLLVGDELFWGNDRLVLLEAALRRD